MPGRRARLGFLTPLGNPTAEPEMMPLMPPGVSLHFSRLLATGPTGTLTGQEDCNRSSLEHIEESTALLTMVHPEVNVRSFAPQGIRSSQQKCGTLRAKCALFFLPVDKRPADYFGN